jgi:hypothetical protein
MNNNNLSFRFSRKLFKKKATNHTFDLSNRKMSELIIQKWLNKIIDLKQNEVIAFINEEMVHAHYYQSSSKSIHT